MTKLRKAEIYMGKSHTCLWTRIDRVLTMALQYIATIRLETLPHQIYLPLSQRKDRERKSERGKVRKRKSEGRNIRQTFQ